MSDSVKPRRYTSPVRAERAARTRREVLAAARELLSSQGYGATTVAQVAARAGVSVDTVYASVGRKPELVVAVIDMVLGSSDEPIPAEQRDYVRAVRAAPSGRDKIAVYAAALGALMPATAPLIEALRHAGDHDEECARTWTRLVERRASNMLLFAADLRSTGHLRADLTDREVADVVWSTNAPEYWLLLRSRGWSPQRYADLLEDLWCRLLLEPEPQVSR
ncbi:AcrR family transcriptional regulator [Phycicoccus badiiscoriae]|uniref:AcrR family transcriptional regulator n=1 Tax=Pedococcus badiiscoriae TaxID=642776 RepID=A0A852WB74_9MICO|nr:TetR/AcrR family transcriptional regulator [Pedococcus badiiscoriae]NYG06308.1 AcrR family transcriptional regulator [Pedococcus badiiscoriae]